MSQTPKRWIVRAAAFLVAGIALFALYRSIEAPPNAPPHVRLF